MNDMRTSKGVRFFYAIMNRGEINDARGKAGTFEGAS